MSWSSPKDLVLFHAGGRAFTAEDVLAAADFRGDLTPIRDAAREGLACQLYGEDEGFESDPDEIDRAAESYRLDRDLIAADDTERWLSQNGLTVEDFTAWLARRAWRDRFSTDMPGILAEGRIGDDAVEAIVWPEVVFGGHLARLSRRFAARIAARLAAGGDWTDAGGTIDFGSLERTYAEACRAVLSDADIERECGFRSASLVRVRVELASFPSMPAAREAWSCVADDGELLADVAARSGAALRQITWFLDELPGPLYQPVWSAVAGQALPPVEHDGRWLVCRLCEKVPPRAADKDVRRRLESVLVERLDGDLIQTDVTWARAVTDWLR